jgi:hypothetical protein
MRFAFAFFLPGAGIFVKTKTDKGKKSKPSPDFHRERALQTKLIP